MRARLLQFLRTAVLATGALGFCLVVAELGARQLAPGASSPSPAPRAAPPDPALAGLPELETVAQLSRPNARGLHHGVLHRTNSRGVRGPEYTREPAPDAVRSVVAGDSFTMGHRVEEDEAYPAQLEARLDAEEPSVRHEVINLGLSGLNAREMLQRLWTTGLAYHPRLVIYGFNVNDLYGPAYVASTPDTRSAFLEEIYRFRNSRWHLLRLLWPHWIVLRSNIHPMPGSQEFETAHNYFENPAAWAQIPEVFDQLAALGRRRGVCVHVFILPTLHQLRVFHPYRRIYDRVQAAAEERGLTVTQAFPVFRGRDATALRFEHGDLHPNAEGHRLLADALAAGLRSLPERCGFGASSPEPSTAR